MSSLAHVLINEGASLVETKTGFLGSDTRTLQPQRGGLAIQRYYVTGAAGGDMYLKNMVDNSRRWVKGSQALLDLRDERPARTYSYPYFGV